MLIYTNNYRKGYVEMNRAKDVIKKNNAMTFTKRLNYSVKEVSLDEYMSAIAKKEANELRAKKAQAKPTPIR